MQYITNDGKLLTLTDGEVLIYKDDKYEIYRNIGDEAIKNVGKLWKNCLRHGNQYLLILPVIFTIYRKDAPKYKKYKKWVCADFIQEEYEGPCNRKNLTLPDHIELQEVLEAIIRPLEPQYCSIRDAYIDECRIVNDIFSNRNDEEDFCDFDYEEEEDYNDEED